MVDPLPAGPAGTAAGGTGVPSSRAGAPRRWPVPPTALLWALAALAWLASAAYMWHFGPLWHLDLRVYRAAGRALLHHGSPFRALFTTRRLPFTYPPFALLVLTPLSFGPLGLVEGAWWLLSALALVSTLYLLIPADLPGRVLPRGRRLALASLLAGAATLAIEPVRSNMDYGQINLLLMWLVVVDLHQRRPGLRGVFIGLAAAVKLTPLVYLLYYAVRRDWRSVGQGAATFSVLSLASWLVLPGDSTLYWLHEATDAARTGPVGFVSNQSWNGMLHRAPFAGHGGDTALWVVLCVAVVVLGGVACERLSADRRPLVEPVLVLALVELLVSPISWSHHWSWMAAAPIAAWTLWRDHRSAAVAVVAVLAVSVASPYLWGVQRGVGAFVADNSLVLAGAAVLVVTAASLLAGRRRPTVGTVRRDRVNPTAGRRPPGRPEGGER
ncbi:MAG: glycosyltransferase 87 family protein [Acidimicrobiales bacterium]